MVISFSLFEFINKLIKVIDSYQDRAGVIFYNDSSRLSEVVHDFFKFTIRERDLFIYHVT